VSGPSLTRRQSAVLDLVQKGASNKAIAKRLGISESTVKIHIGALFKKYCVKNRSQLAIYSTQGRTVSLPDYPGEIEPDVSGWVLRYKGKIVAISFDKKSVGPEWEAIHIIKAKDENVK
jgi:DNA-binding CsgD family transcriptional regulator